MMKAYNLKKHDNIDCPEGFLSDMSEDEYCDFSKCISGDKGHFRGGWTCRLLCCGVGNKEFIHPSYSRRNRSFVTYKTHCQTRSRRNIRLVHVTHRKDQVLAFATFKVSGRRQYEGLILSSKGYDGGTLLLGSKTTLQPIPYGEMGGSGFEYIIGRIFDHKEVASLLIIFSNGSAVSVIVHNGYLWYSKK